MPVLNDHASPLDETAVLFLMNSDRRLGRMEERAAAKRSFAQVLLQRVW